MKFFITTLLSLLTVVIGLFINQFCFTERYSFEQKKPFSGPILFNPYQSLSGKNWVKCNFHAHNSAWFGITNGHGTAMDIHKAYKGLHYGFHAVSNYHKIDTTGHGETNFVSAYEHGYNYNKTHQLVLGGSKVTWLDYLFPQSLDNKQYIIEKLHQTCQVVILNHPGLRKGYTPEELSRLNGYECMEVLNPSVISTALWDAALSAGKKVFIVGDDDLHDITSKDRLGLMCTFVNVSEKNTKNLFSALKTGKSYGAVLGHNQNLDSIPALQNLSVNKDTISIHMDIPAKEITLTGQDGKTLARFHNSKDIIYVLQKKDHYMRATFFYENGTQIYLNPVFFVPKSGYIPGSLIHKNSETSMFRILGVVLLAAWFTLLWLLFSKKKKVFKGKLENVSSNRFQISRKSV